MFKIGYIEKGQQNTRKVQNYDTQTHAEVILKQGNLSYQFLKCNGIRWRNMLTSVHIWYTINLKHDVAPSHQSITIARCIIKLYSIYFCRTNVFYNLNLWALTTCLLYLSTRKGIQTNIISIDKKTKSSHYQGDMEYLDQVLERQWTNAL